VRAIILILLAAAVGLGVLASQQAATIKEQQRQIAAANERRKSEALGLQAQCAKQAKAAWVDGGYSNSPMASYENHYNATLNKCFIYMQSYQIISGNGYDNRALLDVLENKSYGLYILHVMNGSGEGRLRPVKCTVQTVSGEVVDCESKDDFEARVKPYMEG
jgi:type II secretory pathway pseudopilin PulG